MRLPQPSRHLPAATAILVLALALFATDALARAPIRRAFFNVYPSLVGSRLDNLPSHATHCGLCHYDFNGGGPRNPYGAALEAAIPNFATVEQAVQSIQNQDPEADGYSTLTEITANPTYSNLPTFPGLSAANVGSVSNVPVLAEINPYLTPVPASDVTPPTVHVTAPNGGESWTGGTPHDITWTATDNVGVISVDVFYREGLTEPWEPLALAIGNSGTFQWFVQNTPTPAARVKVVARDLNGNVGADSSDLNFTIAATPGGIAPTTLRDFKQPGTQPFGGGNFQEHTSCVGCHGGYDTATEIGHNFKGTMMGHAARDPLFFACLAIAEQDAPSSGDMCLRCHTPFGWMSGRSQPTSGTQLNALDRDGVACDFCHRQVDPVYKPGVSPPEDQAVLNALLPAHRPTTHANGQYVVDPNQAKRGPFSDVVAPHAFIASAFHRSSDLCGTCHDVSNPVFNRTGPADYTPGPFDQEADSISSLTLMPLERTYSEWKNSAYPNGVYAPEFAGNKPGGIVASCQDCHLRDVNGYGANDPLVPLRPDLPLHDMMGGNAWMPGIVASLYASEVDPIALAAGAQRAVAMLELAATLDVEVTSEADSFRAAVTVTNKTGHKLPTGYPEGRRMWLHVVARNEAGQVIWESGAWDPVEGELDIDPVPMVYDAHLGLSPALAGALALPAGVSFHFALNDTVYKDNRIPPLGFTNAAFQTFGGQPVDHDVPGVRYADGQNWDIPTFALPPAARSVTARLVYQSTSDEYVEFLLQQNTTNNAGQVMYDAWVASGRAAPVQMAADSATFQPVDVPGPTGVTQTALALARNPFRGALEARLDLARGARVEFEVFDLRGRRVARTDHGLLAAGTHRLGWDGRDGSGVDAGAGIFWIRVTADAQVLSRQVVRLR